MPNSPLQDDGSSLSSVPTEIDLREVYKTLAAAKRLLIGAPIVVAAVAVACTFLISPKFTSTVKMMPPQQAQSTASALLGSIGGLAGLAGGGAAGAAGALAGLKNPSDQWIGILSGRTIADAMIARFKLRERYDLEYAYETRDELDDRTNIQVGKDGLITIDVTDENPAVAAQMANAYVEELRRMTKELALGEAAQRRVFFEQQLKLAKDGLVNADRALQQAGVVEGVIKSVPEATVGALAEMRAKLVSLDVRISVMRGALTESAPELRAALREQAELRSQLARLEVAAPAALNEKAENYINRVRDVKYYETLFEIMARQYELARADEAREGALIQVIDEAVPAEKKSSPKRALIGLVAFALSLLATGVFILVRRVRESSPA